MHRSATESGIQLYHIQSLWKCSRLCLFIYWVQILSVTRTDTVRLLYISVSTCRQCVCLLKRKINGIGNGRGKEKWPKAFRRAENNVKCKWNTRETSARRSVPHKSALKMDAGHRKVCKLYLKKKNQKNKNQTQQQTLRFLFPLSLSHLIHN